MGRIRLHVALDCSGYSMETFILDNIEPGSTIATDDWQSYNIIDEEQFQREITNQSHFCPVRVVKRIGLNLTFCYNGLTHNSLQSKGDSSHGPL